LTDSLEVQEKRLEVEKKRIDYAFEAAFKMVDICKSQQYPSENPIIILVGVNVITA
jgi:hypothetical protein